jgi:hypothetical protein
LPKHSAPLTSIAAKPAYLERLIAAIAAIAAIAQDGDRLINLFQDICQSLGRRENGCLVESQQ